MARESDAGRSVSPAGILRFGPFELDVRAGELTKHGSTIRLQEQPFQILLMLLVSPGEIVLREDIRKSLWPNNTVVEFDHSINAAIKRLRDALGESAERPRYVETVPRRGYRFIGNLEPLAEEQPEANYSETVVNDDASGRDLTPSRKRLVRYVRITVTAMAVIAVAVFLLPFSRRPTAEFQSLRFSIPAPPDTAFTSIYMGAAISPNGGLLVFTAVRLRASSSTLWLRPMDSLAARELPGTDGAVTPFWSPDGKWIAFFAEGKLKRIEVSGGPVQVLCDAPGWDLGGDGGAWSRDGIIVFSAGGILHRVSATGGPATALSRLDASRQETAHRLPQFLPDGRRFFYLSQSRDPNIAGLYESSLDSPEECIRILGTNAKATFVPARSGRPGYLLWLRERTLVAQRFNADRLRLEGNAVPLAEEIAVAAAGNAAFWTSDSGILVYRSGSTENSRMSWIGRDGTLLEAVGPAGAYGVPRISPDGRRVALRGRTASGNTDVWVYEFERGTMTRLTFDPAAETFPVWSPDGRQVAFTARGQLYRKNADGSGPEERLTDSPNPKRLLDWNGNGHYLLYVEMNPQTQGDLWILPLQNDRRPTPFLRTSFHEFYGQFSPDAKWIAYTSDESGRSEVYVRSTSPSGGKRQISSTGGIQPRWRGDGRELFYLSGLKMMAANIRTGKSGVEADSAHALFSVSVVDATFYTYDVTADGTRFVVLRPDESNGSGFLTVVSNWQFRL